MTVTIKSEHIGDYMIEISQEKFDNGFNVGLYKKYNNPIYGETYTTENEHYYPTIEKAKARYNTLKRMYR